MDSNSNRNRSGLSPPPPQNQNQQQQHHQQQQQHPHPQALDLLMHANDSAASASTMQEAKDPEAQASRFLTGPYRQELSLARAMNVGINPKAGNASLCTATGTNTTASGINKKRMQISSPTGAASSRPRLDARLDMNQLYSQHSPSGTGAGVPPFPRAPTSPGSWNAGVGAGVGVGAAMMPHQSLLATDDFAGANAALRRNLVSLQQHQQQAPFAHAHSQAHSHSQQQQHYQQQQYQHQQHQQHQQTYGDAFNSLSSSAPTNNPTSQGMGVGMGVGMGMYPDTLTGTPHNIWATEMLLRTGAAGGASGNPSLANATAGGVDESIMQLQLLRQQQDRIRQLEQLEGEANMRRQLQALRQNNNPASVNSNANIQGNNNAMDRTGSMLHHAMGATTSAGTAVGNDALAFRESLLLQHQMQPGMQQSFGGMQQGTRSNFGAAMDHQGFDSIGSGRSFSMRNIPLPEAQLNRSESASAVSRSANFRRSSSALSSSSIARATPMVGPIAPPLPAPPSISEANYQLPPIEEGETRHYDQRIHVPLAIEEDHNWLSEFQCFVRKELLQVFRASHQDVKIRVASKKVYYKQVGIRCKFCAHWKPSTRAIRSSAFPSSIRQLYQSFTMMLRDHFGNCPAIPTPLKDRFLALKRNNTQGASDSMRYWIYSAVKLGMVDSECGIVLNEQTQAAARNKPPFGTTSTNGPNPNTSNADSPPRLLVKPDDLEEKVIESEFLYTLLTQYQLIRLLSTECIGNRKSLRPGVPGLGCRYCCHAGRMGLSRVFPAKKKQLPTQIQDLYDHMRRCNLCPVSVKEELKDLKEKRDRERSESSSAGAVTKGLDEKEKSRRIVDESDKGFVDLLWQRLGHRGELATPIV